MNKKIEKLYIDPDDNVLCARNNEYEIIARIPYSVDDKSGTVEFKMTREFFDDLVSGLNEQLGEENCYV